jgi:predicted dehydrogenase
MYSTGRGTAGYGTILPAINEWQRENNFLNEVIFVGTNGNNSISLKEKSNVLFEETGVNFDVSFLPKPNTKNSLSYKTAIKQIKKPACAIIVVPDHLHFEVARECIDMDLPVLVVKPLTSSIHEAKKLIAMADGKSLYAAVEFHKRYDKANIMIRDKFKSGDLGELLYCWVEYSQRKSIPTKVFKNWAEKTSILQYLGVHYIDIVRFVSDASPIRVMATGQKKWLISKGLDIYDSIQCNIEWMLPNGKLFSQSILTNWIDPESSSAMSDQKIKLVGTNGRFESDQKDRGIKITSDNNGFEQPNPDFCFEYSNNAGKKEWRGYGIDSVKNFLTDVSKINSGSITLDDIKSNRSTFSEAIISTAVVEAAHKSLEQNNIWIKLDI